MKEQYFTRENIQQKTTFFLSRFELMRQRHHRRLSARCALCVLDMQDFFLSNTSHAFIPSAQAIIPGILQLLTRFTELDLPILFTRHLNTRENAGLMETWWQDLIRDSSPLSEISADFTDFVTGPIVKTRYDAFIDTPLEERLRKLNVTDIIITGVMTHLCCETTARSAFNRDFNVFFPVDGTATYTEQFHLASCLNLGHGFAYLLPISELLDDLETLP